MPNANEPNFFISWQDTEAYGTYCWYCGLVGVSPRPLLQFLMLTEKSVKGHWKDFKSYTTRELDDRVAEIHPAPRRYSEAELVLHDLIATGGFTIGVLKPDGTVHPVRPQMKTNRGEETVSSPLRKRFCKRCRSLKPADGFAKKRNLVREVCKKCDSQLRVARRRNKKLLQAAAA